MAPNSAGAERQVREIPAQPSKARAMAGRHKEEVPDEVHQNQILRELYLKELRAQRLYTQYHVNPLRKGEGSPRGGEGEGVLD